MKGSTLRRLWPISGLVLVAVLAFWLARQGGLTGQLREVGPVPFFALMALLPAVGIPITPLFLAAGAMFGAGVGLVGAWLALALNLGLCYWLARHGLRRMIEWLLRAFDQPLPDVGTERGRAIRVTLMVKATPGVPAFVKNYGLGVAGVSFPIYFVLSLLMTGLYGTALVLFGDVLVERGTTRMWMILLAVACAVVGLIVWRAIRRSRSTPAP